MKSNLLAAIRLTIACLLIPVGLYTCIVFGIAQLAPNHGKGDTVRHNGRLQYSNIGQAFTQDKYFWSRPSAVNYHADASAGSNKGTSNPEYLQQVRARIDTLIAHNPGIDRSAIPVDLVTASGSGLDPNISVQAARVQIKRIAQLRGIPEENLHWLVTAQIEKPVWKVFGPEKINVLKLNIALDQIASK